MVGINCKSDEDFDSEFISSNEKDHRNFPTELVKDYKLSYAAKLLITTNLSVKEIIYKIGITNKSYFYNEFFKNINFLETI